MHRVKGVRTRSFSVPYFLAFGLNTEIYSVNLCIQSECGKIWTRKTPHMNIFYTVLISENLMILTSPSESTISDGKLRFFWNDPEEFTNFLLIITSRNVYLNQKNMIWKTFGNSKSYFLLIATRYWYQYLRENYIFLIDIEELSVT